MIGNTIAITLNMFHNLRLLIIFSIGGNSWALFRYEIVDRTELRACVADGSDVKAKRISETLCPIQNGKYNTKAITAQTQLAIIAEVSARRQTIFPPLRSACKVAKTRANTKTISTGAELNLINTEAVKATIGGKYPRHCTKV